VIYLNTFTKSLSPSLRISYMVLPPALAQRYRRELNFYSSTVPSFEQHILALFMQRGHLERHIWRTRKRYKLRRDALISALKRSGLTQFTRLSGADAGLHLLLTAQNGQTEEALISAAAAAGVRIYPVSACYDMQPPKEYIPTFIMGYARMDEKQLDTACDLLYRSWQALS
jgi:GntR family transcriptional regulator/MocR family aminotransferase